MKKTFLFCGLILAATMAWATPANTAVLDGKPIEYDSTDLRASFVGASSWGPNGTLTNLFVTWDSNYVYVALQAWQADNNKLVVLIDVDPDAGTGATTTTNWTSVLPDYIQYNDYGWVNGGTFGLDYMVASEGFYNNAIRINYDGAAAPSTSNTDSLFDSGNGSTPAGTPVDMASLNDATACPLKGFEVRIPWSTLYSSNRFGTVETNELVPRGASLRLLAGIHNNDPASAYSSPDTIPNQVVEDFTNGVVTAATYMDVLLDTDTNGIPDMLSGDVNAPYISAVSGAAGGSSIYVDFNESVTLSTIEMLANWDVGGAAPISAIAQGASSVLLGLATPIADTNLLSVRASGVEDAAANSRDVGYCLFPAASGIPSAVTVTFQVNTNSGMGVSSTHSRPTAFFVNGSALPLVWGTPPLQTNSLVAIPGSNGWATVDVTFKPGSPSELEYKYTGVINGTNNYETVNLAAFAAAARRLTLNTNGSPQTVVDYLGAAGYPLRNPADTNVPPAHNRLYEDPQRGDAGVRVRREILFQLDLSLYVHTNLMRVCVAGSDPLRGFNYTGGTETPNSDFPEGDGWSGWTRWTDLGIELTDGDGDGIFTGSWAWSTNGFDSTTVPGAPNSLVGGDWDTYPYTGTWVDRRSPRSFIYKFYVITENSNHYESPLSDIEYYIVDPDETAQILLDPFQWDNDGLPIPPPSNAPTLTGVMYTGTTPVVAFENVLTEGAHGVRVSSNVLDNVEGYADYGILATRISTNGGVAQWTADVLNASDVKEFYAPYAGLAPDQTPDYWVPSFIPATATTWRVYFSQINTDMQGHRNLAITGPFAGWGDGTPMTFIGNGSWMVDVALAAGVEDVLEYKVRSGDSWLGGDNLKAIRGGAGATWTPDQPAAGGLFTLTFDAAGTTLVTATNLQAHVGYDTDWHDTVDLPMTNTAGTVWEYTFTVVSNATVSVNWVFNGYLDGETTLTWYSPNADWKAFLDSFVNP
jgi:hypothetical protein